MTMKERLGASLLIFRLWFQENNDFSTPSDGTVSVLVEFYNRKT
jgi:hypothetical protein